MKKVNDTKQPTVKQMISMSENLREKLKTYISISIEVGAYTHVDPVEVNYKVYMSSGSGYFHNHISWQELLTFYHQLMRK